MRRTQLWLVVAAGLVFMVATTAAYQRVQNGSESLPAGVNAIERLKPLPPGPPRASAAEASTEQATLDDMIVNAPIVFIGRVTAIGGSEVVSPASAVEGPELTVHRTRFDVLEAMRGDASIVDVAQFDWGEPVLFEVGMTYLIFAETRQLGSLKLPYLVPYGYHQGIYQQLAPGVFGNESNGSISIATLGERLGSSAFTR